MACERDRTGQTSQGEPFSLASGSNSTDVLCAVRLRGPQERELIRRISGEHLPAMLQQSGIPGGGCNPGDLQVNRRRAGIGVGQGIP